MSFYCRPSRLFLSISRGRQGIETHGFVFFRFPGEWTLSSEGFRLQNPAKLLKLTNTWPLLSKVCLGLR